VLHAPFGDEDPELEFISEHLFKRLVKPEEIAAVVVEPVQGEGGYVFPPDEWLPKLRDLCTEHGILLVADEIQSGMGRTGTMWAVEHWGVEPDILLAGKGLASGMPLGAMIARDELMAWPMGAHGSTYGGNPVACAAALATIDLIQKELLGNTVEVGNILLEGLGEMATRQALIKEIRGRGLMIGIQFESPEVADAVEMAAFRQGMLTLRCGDATIRMSPPLVISAEQARTGLRIFEDACAHVADWGPDAFAGLVGTNEAGPGTPEGA
jgi:4-aminobutyrate aminotransferase